MDSKMINRDLVTYSALWFGSLFLYFWVIPNHVILRAFAWTADIGFDGRTFPQILAVCLFIVATLGLVKTVPLVLKARKAKRESGAETGAAKNTDDLYTQVLPLLVFLACVLFVVLFSTVGFLIAAAVATPIILVLLKANKWYYYVIAYAFAGVLYLVFTQLLRVPIP